MTRARLSVRYDQAEVVFELEGSRRWVNEKFPVLLRTVQIISAEKARECGYEEKVR